MRHWKDLFNLKRRSPKYVPVSAISGKRVQSLTTPCRSWQLPNHSLIARGFNQKDRISRLFPGYENRPEWYDPTSLLFFDLVNAGTPPHHAAWLVHNRRDGRRTSGSVMRGKPGNPLIVIIKTVYPHSSRTDPHDEIKMRFRDNSPVIRNVSAGVHSCDNERTKYAVTCVPELLHRIHELAKARIKFPKGVRR